MKAQKQFRIYAIMTREYTFLSLSLFPLSCQGRVRSCDKKESDVWRTESATAHTERCEISAASIRARQARPPAFFLPTSNYWFQLPRALYRRRRPLSRKGALLIFFFLFHSYTLCLPCLSKYIWSFLPAVFCLFSVLSCVSPFHLVCAQATHPLAMSLACWRHSCTCRLHTQTHTHMCAFTHRFVSGEQPQQAWLGVRGSSRPA